MGFQSLGYAAAFAVVKSTGLKMVTGSSPGSMALASVLELNGPAGVAAVVAASAGAPVVQVPLSTSDTGPAIYEGMPVPVFPDSALEAMDAVAIARLGSRVRGESTVP